MKFAMYPIIGLTARTEQSSVHSSTLRLAYVRAVEEAGGIPVLIPILSKTRDFSWLETFDALILTGGEDINPLLYRQDPHPRLGGINTVRDEFEIALTQYWLNTGKPLLGICRGLQALQVAAGGALIQDILATHPESLRHAQSAPRQDPAHMVKVKPNTTLAKLMELHGDVAVNSIHHQAAESPAAGFKIAATSSDGIIEAIEASDGSPILGVQWHPEEMSTAPQKRLLKNFVAGAKSGQVPVGALFSGSSY